LDVVASCTCPMSNGVTNNDSDVADQPQSACDNDKGNMQRVINLAAVKDLPRFATITFKRVFFRSHKEYESPPN